MLKHAYVIRWSRFVTLGAEYCEGGPWYEYVKDIRVSRRARGVWTTPELDSAIKFSSWAEAADVAAFMIHHVDDLYEDALDVVEIDL